VKVRSSVLEHMPPFCWRVRALENRVDEACKAYVLARSRYLLAVANGENTAALRHAVSIASWTLATRKKSLRIMRDRLRWW